MKSAPVTESTFTPIFVRLLKILSIIILALGTYAAWIVVTTPNAADINTCLVTKKYNVTLCKKSKNYTHLSHISNYLKNLILIAEDSNFYYHNGFDWGEMKNSVESNFNLLRFNRGGSTITQQLAKNVFLPFEKTLSRKIREALLTADLEKLLTKNEIFEKYLNVIEFGPHIFGVAEASWHYFSKAPDQLNLLESAFLTYLIPNPNVHYRTFKNKQLTPYARRRILDLCYRMYRFHRISEDQYLAATETADDFPWFNLPEGQLARLNNRTVGDENAGTINTVETDDVLPNFDSANAIPELPSAEIITGDAESEN